LTDPFLALLLPILLSYDSFLLLAFSLSLSLPLPFCKRDRHKDREKENIGNKKLFILSVPSYFILILVIDSLASLSLSFPPSLSLPSLLTFYLFLRPSVSLKRESFLILVSKLFPATDDY
jgi:hypothetical protein